MFTFSSLVFSLLQVPTEDEQKGSEAVMMPMPVIVNIRSDKAGTNALLYIRKNK